MKKWMLVLLMIFGVGFWGTSLVQAQSIVVEVVADNLEIPWSIAADENAKIFYVTQRTGSILKIDGDQITEQSVLLEKKISTASEAGLLGFVLATDFADTQTAFAYYTYQDEDGQFNRIVQLQLDEAADSWQEDAILLDLIPSGSVHHGGRLAIGPDEKLYATTGDAADAGLAQNLDSLAGKILRLNLDGSIPDDNPFENSYVYSYGHRNPQGLTWAEDGSLYASEHGQSSNDEINQIEAGANYGWPVIEGMQTQEGMMTPFVTSGEETTWAPSGMEYFEGKLYVATLRGAALMEIDLADGSQRQVVTGLGRIRDVYLDLEDGALYFISNNTDGRGLPLDQDDKLYRLLLSDILE